MNDYFIACFPLGDTMAEYASSLQLFGPMNRESAKALSVTLYDELSSRDENLKQECRTFAVKATGASLLSKEICEIANVPEGSTGFDVKVMADEIYEVCKTLGL